MEGLGLMNDPVLVFCETFTGPKGRHCYCVDIEPEKCSNCLAEETLKHYRSLLARLEKAESNLLSDDLKERIEQTMTEHWDMKACDCLVCEVGRVLRCGPREKYLPHKKCEE
jgi:uncharacterized protein (UPF0335 family)